MQRLGDIPLFNFLQTPGTKNYSIVFICFLENASRYGPLDGNIYIANSEWSSNYWTLDRFIIPEAVL